MPAKVNPVLRPRVRVRTCGGCYPCSVRKRIVIGLSVGVVIGVGIFLISRPREWSVEWHKKQLLRARYWGMADEGIYRYGRREWMHARIEQKTDRMVRHQNALIRLGYLEERPVRVYNHGVVLSNLVGYLNTNSVEGLDADFL